MGLLALEIACLEYEAIHGRDVDLSELDDA
jgi:hypothetical protein